MKKLILALALIPLATTGCFHEKRMTVITGTTIALHATPGDTGGKPPSITFGYKRAETAIIPTAAKAAVDNATNQSDAYSVIAVLGAKFKWFHGGTNTQFIATGHAARALADSTSFANSLPKQ